MPAGFGRIAALACALTACGRVGFDGAGEAGESGDDGVTSCSDGDRHTLFENHCYFTYDRVRNATDAAKTCSDAGAHLATIASVAENNAVLGLYRDETQWLGLSDEGHAGTFAWADGSPFTYTNWSETEPNNMTGNEHCVEMAVSGRWNDRDCADTIHFVCERDPVQNSAPCTEGDAHLAANGHCYSEWSQRVSYADAEAACASFGAHLVTTHDLDENDIVRALRADVAWIGLTDRAVEGTFASVTGEPVTYTNWAAGEPNNSGPGEDCAAMNDPDGVWNDLACTELNQYICEREGVPTTCTFGDVRDEIDGHCYWRVKSALTWANADLACAAEVPGATLASIPDSDAERAIFGLADGTLFWIGGSDSASEGTFTWTNGDPFGFTQWGDAEPNGGSNENCIEWNLDGWNDTACGDASFYVCERR